MSNSMQHLNGNQFCVIDVETTGLDSTFHEIWQICILPLDADLKPRKDVNPFYILIKPEHLERINWDLTFFKKHKSKILDAANRGHDVGKAAELLDNWITKLDLPLTKYGRSKKIEPLGQNYGFDCGFIKQWLGIEEYEEKFDYHYRDTMVAAHFLNDQAAFHAEKVPYSKVSLNWLANQLGIPHDRAHDALADCRTTAEVYRRMCQKGIVV